MSVGDTSDGAPSGRGPKGETGADRRFAFWRAWLMVASAVFALQAVSWIFIGGFDPFGYYESRLASALLDAQALTPEGRRAFGFGVGLLGATTAAFFVLVFLIARHALADRERWAHRALVWAVAVWFVLDSTFSVAVGAYFNVVLVNLPCAIALGLPLLATARGVRAP